MQLRVFALKMNDIVPQTGKYPTAIWRFTRVPIRLCRCGDMWWVGWGRGICWQCIKGLNMSSTKNIMTNDKSTEILQSHKMKDLNFFTWCLFNWRVKILFWTHLAVYWQCIKGLNMLSTNIIITSGKSTEILQSDEMKDLECITWCLFSWGGKILFCIQLAVYW